MNVLLREVRGGSRSIAASIDTELGSNVITIGGAPDQQIQLLGRTVGPRHAVIRGPVVRPSLACVGRLTASVNGEEERSVRLGVGDDIEIGGHHLLIITPPTGFDLAIELRRNTEIDHGEFEAAFRTDLQQTWLAKRSPPWLLIVLTALFGFVIPFMALQPGGIALSTPALEPLLGRASALWSTGPLAPGHRQLIGQRCADCHQALFTQVQDGSCLSCHKTVGDHVARSRLAQTSLGGAQRCASCHREHGEPTGNLVDRSDGVCVGCHAKAPPAFGALKVQRVSGFGAGRHPPFAAGAQLANVAGGRRGLKFSHEQHFDGGQVRRADGGTLGCADCHKLSADGEHFEPTTMARNCVGCHELTFDPDAPDRHLPHGQPREVVRMLEDFFAHKLSDPNRTNSRLRERRRLPGHQEEEDPMCAGSIRKCAMEMTAREVQTQFERRGCITCHEVKDTGSKDLTDRFQVEPIRLLHDHFPAARFPHRSHQIQKGIAGDKACLSCHPASGSKTGEKTGEPRLPDLPICENCHADTPTRDRTRLECVSCHAYHPHS